MITNATFIFRIALAWFLAYLLFAVTLNGVLFPRLHLEGLSVAFGFLLIGVVVSSAVSHLRRLHLIAGELGDVSPSNRQRRQIELSFEAGEVFDMVDAAIRELPGSGAIESARDSLQVRARVERIATYVPPSLARATPLFHFLEGGPNQLMALITPHNGISRVTLICEPCRAAWTDWFLVDDGSNLENAEAVTRALSRRLEQRRRGEQAEVKQTVTEKELAVAKLNLLHAQVEPHFLYNTLASAQLLTRSDPALADAMLGNLIVYLRHAVPRTEDTLSTIGAELERTRAYLDILKIRMGARLTLNIDVAPALLAVPLPSMMLQTLAENAIKHGLEPKPGGGNIWIMASAAGAAVSVTVADDGRGFSLDGGGTGIGLSNVRERLKLIYGAAAAFSIVSNFPGGVAATITVPGVPATVWTKQAPAGPGGPTAGARHG